MPAHFFYLFKKSEKYSCNNAQESDHMVPLQGFCMENRYGNRRENRNGYGLLNDF